MYGIYKLIQISGFEEVICHTINPLPHRDAF